MKCKLEIVTGFLGGGKTSFINSYITTEICKGEKILVVLLEKGATSVKENSNYIKTLYLKEVNNIKELLLVEIEKSNYDRTIIEFNGTYNLNIIRDLLKDKEIKERISFYGNYYIGDADSLEIYIKNMGELILPFVQSSKLIVLNNLDSISRKKEKSLIKIIESINFTAPIIYSSSIKTLNNDLKLSKYFRYGMLTRGIKAFLSKGGG